MTHSVDKPLRLSQLDQLPTQSELKLAFEFARTHAGHEFELIWQYPGMPQYTLRFMCFNDLGIIGNWNLWISTQPNGPLWNYRGENIAFLHSSLVQLQQDTDAAAPAVQARQAPPGQPANSPLMSNHPPQNLSQNMAPRTTAPPSSSPAPQVNQSPRTAPPPQNVPQNNAVPNTAGNAALAAPNNQQAQATLPQSIPPGAAPPAPINQPPRPAVAPQNMPSGAVNSPHPSMPPSAVPSPQVKAPSPAVPLVSPPPIGSANAYPTPGTHPASTQTAIPNINSTFSHTAVPIPSQVPNLAAPQAKPVVNSTSVPSATTPAQNTNTASSTSNDAPTAAGAIANPAVEPPFLAPIAPNLAAMRQQHEKLLQPETGIIAQWCMMYFLEQEYYRFKSCNYPVVLVLFEMGVVTPARTVQALPASSIRRVGKRIARSKRKIDQFGHFGQTVYALMLPHTEYESGKKVGERIRRLILTDAIENRVPLVLRAGIAALPTDGTDLNALINTALKKMKPAAQESFTF